MSTLKYYATASASKNKAEVELCDFKDWSFVTIGTDNLEAIKVLLQNAMADRARLLWIEREHWMDGGEFIDGVKHTEVRFLVPGKAGDYPDGIRNAIDAAMRGANAEISHDRERKI